MINAPQRMRSKKKMHFEISERKILLRVFDVLFVLTALYLIGKFIFFDYFKITTNNYFSSIVLALYITVVGTVFEMYNLQISSNKFQILKSIMLTSAITTLFYLLTPFYTPVLPSNRLQIVLFFFAIFFSLLVWRNFYITFLTTNRFIKRVIFVGNGKKIDDLVDQLVKADPHYKVVGYLSTNNKTKESKIKKIELDALEEIVMKNQISEIVVTNSYTRTIGTELYSHLLKLLENGVIIREYSEVYEYSTNRLPIQFHNSKELYKFFPFSRSNQNALYAFYTRFFDILLSVFGIICLGIMIPVLLILNVIWNKGPLLYTQERVGRNGNLFKIYKLRTMIINAEVNGAVFASTNDARITPFGRLLRRLRIDEVPQFINVLKAEMSIIGPRPERPMFVEEIAKNIPLYQTRHVIKPGLTGWAQVNYPYGENLEDSLMKLRYDLYYIKHRSLFLDVNIVMKTLSTILFARGQ